MNPSVFLALLFSCLATGVAAYADDDDKAFLDMLDKRADELISKSASQAKGSIEKQNAMSSIKAMDQKPASTRNKTSFSRKAQTIASNERRYVPAINRAERQASPTILKAAYSKPSHSPIVGKIPLKKAEDPLILGLKQKIQNNSAELRKEQAYLEKAYMEVLIPLSRELAHINSKILEKETMGRAITQQEKNQKAGAEKRIQALRDQLQSTRDKVKKLENDQKELSATLYQYVLVSN